MISTYRSRWKSKGFIAAGIKLSSGAPFSLRRTALSSHPGQQPSPSPRPPSKCQPGRYSRRIEKRMAEALGISRWGASCGLSQSSPSTPRHYFRPRKPRPGTNPAAARPQGRTEAVIIRKENDYIGSINRFRSFSRPLPRRLSPWRCCPVSNCVTAEPEVFGMR